MFRAEPACRKCAAARHDLARWEASPGRLLPAAAYVEGEPL